MEGFEFGAKVTHTFVNGQLVYGNGQWNESHKRNENEICEIIYLA
ncbi:MAG: hypothetical protein WKG06_21775 [Segetibacter sp.]